MRRMARFRRQLLLAMGIPVAGCGGGSAPKADETPMQELVESYSDDGEGSGIAPTSLGPKDCRPDELYETACGTPQSQCGPTGDSLANVTQSKLYVTGAAPKSLRKFTLHEADTRALGGDAGCCYAHCTAIKVAFSAPSLDENYYYSGQKCIPEPPAGTRVPASSNTDCPAAAQLGGGMLPYDDNHTGKDDNCCYKTSQRRIRRHYYRGRPARVSGEVALAGSRQGHGWSAGVELTADPPGGVRALLARRWLEDARMEHASIASFAKLSLDLLALGAPAKLVGDTQAAGADEVVHAQLTFALASLYADHPLEPAPFRAATEMRATGDLAQLLRETFVDGCIGETVAACEARRASEVSREPAVSEILAQIAEDESRHAQLAWEILAWGLRQLEPAQRREIGAALREVLADAQSEPPASCESCETSTYGVLCAHQAADARRLTLDEIVEPCLSDLLDHLV